MSNRSVKEVQFAEMMDMGGFPVRQPMPAKNVDRVDPFLLLHHHTGYIANDSHPRETGVSPHPHRGFSPVTFVFKGDIHHRDSRGNSAIVKAGGVQWMDAGMGLIHSERPSVAFAKKGGQQEIVQLWINTPRIHKMDQPHYQALDQEMLPQIPVEHGGTLSVIAGNYLNTKGPAQAKLDVIILRGDLIAGSQHNFQIPEQYNVIIYVLNGNIEIDNYGQVNALHMVHFNNDGDTIRIAATQKTQLLVLAGVPINEKVESYGPFVMTSQTEIMQAIRDYQIGKMGMLVEEWD